MNITSTTNEPTHLDLFSGIGGFALAARWAGFRTIGFCDNEPYAQAVIKKHWPEVPIHGDIKALDGTAYRGVTLLTGGFPCQPFSCAGKQRGKDDDRYLWPEMLANWATEPGVGRVAHGVSNRVDRIKGLGNAIVPQVAYEILKAITLL